MISSTDFPCFVDIYNHEKCDPVKQRLSVDEIRHFANINEYMAWLVDIDSEPEPWEEQ